MLRAIRNFHVQLIMPLLTARFARIQPQTGGPTGAASWDWLRRIGPPGVWVAGYLVTVFLIKRFDPFGADFDTSGPILFLYNVARVGFLVYFLSILLGLGLLILGRLERIGLPRLGYLDRLLLGFWLGAAVLTLIMLPLGFLKLYYPLTALVLTVPILVFAFSPLTACSVEGKRRLAELWRTLLGAGASSERRVAGAEPSEPRRTHQVARLGCIVAAAGILSLLLLLLVTRCIYPGETTNDAYEHYWPYQREVIRSHGIWPNDVWYDFYAAKGFGLNFLAMLLTDDLACQSVTFLLLAASAGLLFAVTRRLTGQNFWALLSTVAYLGAFPFPLAEPLSWGGFHSHHLQAAAWLACLTWLAVLTLDDSRLHRSTWFGISFVLAAGFTVFFPDFAVFTLSLLSLLAGVLWLRQQRAAARFCLLSLSGIVVLLAALLLVNHAISGMINDNPKRATWALADQKKFSRWCSPYLVEYFNEVSEQYEGAINAPSFAGRNLEHYERLARIEYLKGYYPGHLGAIVVALAAAGCWGLRGAATGARLIHLALMVPFLLAAVVIGEVLRLDASVYRNYVFLLFYQCAILGIGWMLAFACLPRKLSAFAVSLFAWGVVAVTCSQAFNRYNHHQPADHPGKLTDYLAFAAGQISVQEALERGDGLWPEAVAAKKRVGYNTPILCLSRVKYEIPGLASHAFPGSGLLTEPSRTSLRGQWHIVAFEDAASARHVLTQQGIDYFLIDPSQDMVGCIPFGPLFEPQGLADRFEVVESWGGLYLLTWPGNGGRRLPSSFVRLFEERMASLRKDRLACVRLHEILASLYRFNKGRGYPLKHPRDLPRLIATAP